MTNNNDKFFIKGKHLGPIMEIDQVLSNNNQNMIYAPNGTGKSFLARAFRALDAEAVHDEDLDLAESIVSEESKSNKAELSFGKGRDEYASLQICADTPKVSRKCNDKIFHVFSTDFVDSELRRNKYVIDGNIQREIIVGKENSKIAETKSSLELSEISLSNNRNTLAKNLEQLKSNLVSQFSINRKLGQYTNITLDNALITQGSDNDLVKLKETTTIYDKFKSIPNDTVAPSVIPPLEIQEDYSNLIDKLADQVKLSQISSEVRERILKDANFFKSGVALSDGQNCPLCDQNLTDEAAKLIGAYENYFNDAESKFKASLELIDNKIKSDRQNLKSKKLAILESIVDFDSIKEAFPSLSETNLSDPSDDIDLLDKNLLNLSESIRTKLSNISVPIFLPDEVVQGFNNNHTNEKIIDNNVVLKNLSDTMSNKATERKIIQGDICLLSFRSFCRSNEEIIRNIGILSQQVAIETMELKQLKLNYGDKIKARDKVADTFSYLLSYMFGNKYEFDTKDFKITRNKCEMSRGGDRTLSDGEKTVLAFCYFIAQVHLKVETISDYQNVFIVLDDPVSSLSNNYVFNIVSCLKMLRFNNGNIQIDGKGGNRPKTLILTHNDYFFNLVHGNNVVKETGLFLLSNEDGSHSLKPQRNFVSPHTFHLQKVYKVSKGLERPDYTTPNSIRSVVEGVWKFCRSDITNFSEFISEIAANQNIPLKSALINQLSHGGNFSDQSYLEDQIIVACTDAIEIMNFYAAGQIKVIERSLR